MNGSIAYLRTGQERRGTRTLPSQQVPFEASDRTHDLDWMIALRRCCIRLRLRQAVDEMSGYLMRPPPLPRRVGFLTETRQMLVKGRDPLERKDSAMAEVRIPTAFFKRGPPAGLRLRNRLV